MGLLLGTDALGLCGQPQERADGLHCTQETVRSRWPYNVACKYRRDAIGLVALQRVRR